METSRSRKRAFVEFFDGNDDDVEKVYRFQILLPNGTNTRLILRDPGDEMLLAEFIHAIKIETTKSAKTIHGARRNVAWNEDIYLEDLYDRKFKKRICFNQFKPNKCHILMLHDGAGESVNIYKNMWDLTPDTDLLAELPADYTFETALADLIDNSLQAVWSNGPGERRLISGKDDEFMVLKLFRNGSPPVSGSLSGLNNRKLLVEEQKIVIFDSGPGMDGSDENSISKWGKMGSSNNRISRPNAIGGKPPYLMPFFGMFGYGGPIASMHLGRLAVVSSKTKESRKVYTLHLERDALLNKSTSKCVWRTDGGIRDPLKKELLISPHGSFTQVEIFDLKFKSLEIFKLQCILKDIYFPYIQCDEDICSRRTTMPIEFQINGMNLAEVEGGEVAVTNLHSCNGPAFVLQLHLSVYQENVASKSPGSKACRKANARLKCVYFPIVEGKENIDRILEKLDADGTAVTENFETFPRVSIRRLGRLLPDSRWGMLPFMEPKQKKGDKAHLLKRCCLRVKCFIETDAGFSPTPSKTDLAHHDPFTTALRNFGNAPLRKETVVEISRDGNPLRIAQLEKEYQDWIIRMHEKYDEEMECGEDEPVLVVGSLNKKKLGISADVVRVHHVIRRKGLCWKSGQKVKVIKGAVGCTKNNLYVTLEYILLEGFQGDAGGEARLICRPMGCSDERGCSLVVHDGNPRLEIHNSISFPISVIDSGKFQAIDLASWNNQLEKRKEKFPSTIDVLTSKQCSQLEIFGELPKEVPVYAGHTPPTEIVAVIRPASFSTASPSKSLDQKYIVKEELDMSMDVRRMREGKDCQEGEFICAERVKASSRNGLHGLYIFSLRQKQPNLFHKAGTYKFSFSITCKDSTCKRREMTVVVKPAIKVEKKVLSDERGPVSGNTSFIIRNGSLIPYLYVACYDGYSNRIPILSIPDVEVKIIADEFTIIHINELKLDLSSDQLSLVISDIVVESSKLDRIRPSYEALLEICSQDDFFSFRVPCKVMPGPLSSMKMECSSLVEKSLAPDSVIEVLKFEMLDAYGNHVEGGVEVSVEVAGLCFEDRLGLIRKVDEHGYLNLSGVLRVVAGFGSRVSFSISFGEKIIFEEELQVESRELRVVSKIPGYCVAGSRLENVIFQIFDSNGVVDEAIHGQHHTLALSSGLQNVDATIQYAFQHGRCVVPSVQLPYEQGTFHLVASHVRFPELCTSFEITITQAPKMELITATDINSNIYPSHYTDARIPFLPDLSQSLSQIDIWVGSIIYDIKKLDEDVAAVALRIKNHEGKLKLLSDLKESILNEINDLQAKVEPRYLAQADVFLNTKEQIVKRIERRDNTAAAVLCNLAKAIQSRESQEHFVQDIIGIVALLGTVSDSNISRIFAEYLGESYMLAIVCKSYEAASALERYGEDGKVDPSCALHEAAARMGIKIKKRFLVICLEEIRPYKGKLIYGDAQRKLALQKPLLPSKAIPAGFVGYAVNMVNLDMHQLNTRTIAGYSLRETLFYRLFGELQVYRTRADMKRAKLYITHGAVSLDGSIMRENGIISLGECEPDVIFPVIGLQLEGQLCHYPSIIGQIEEKKSLLEVTDAEIREESEAHEKALAKFRKKSEKMRNFLEHKKSLGNLLEYSSLQKPS